MGFDVKRRNVEMNMSSLQGYITASYEELVNLFGEPTYMDCDDDEYAKVDVMWTVLISTPTGPVKASIYNWKDFDGGRYCQSAPSYKWHIGGFNDRAVYAVEGVIGTQGVRI